MASFDTFSNDEHDNQLPHSPTTWPFDDDGCIGYDSHLFFVISILISSREIELFLDLWFFRFGVGLKCFIVRP